MRIVIVGGSFGGLTAAFELRKIFSGQISFGLERTVGGGRGWEAVYCNLSIGGFQAVGTRMAEQATALHNPHGGRQDAHREIS